MCVCVCVCVYIYIYTYNNKARGKIRWGMIDQHADQECVTASIVQRIEETRNERKIRQQRLMRVECQYLRDWVT